jgi:pyruvate kinase
MTKILATVGPASSNKKNIKFILDKSEIVRLNMSHNLVNWHKKNINLIKKRDPNKYILVDIPGAKPRTLNKNTFKINKGQRVSFAYKIKNKNIIPISNPLPKLHNKKIKYFSVSDGNFLFKFVSLKNNKLIGISSQTFDLQPKKGLNIPYSIYDDKYQSKIYINFVKKISKFNYDCVGLSFVQSAKIIKILKNYNKNKIFISKIENFLGYLNRKDIIMASDAIMIDRGDLAAEVGNEKLTEYVENIIKDCKLHGKPIIIATENLNSLINNLTPSKSDILNLDYYISKKVDYIMLSDETATSSNWRNTINWLHNYLNSKRKDKPKTAKLVDINEILKKLDSHVLVIFSKKGFFLEKFRGEKFSKLILFTENKYLAKAANLKENINSFYAKFPKKNIDKFLYKNIKSKKNIIFKNDKIAFLINVTFPRKNSRANTFIILSKKDFS